MRASRWVDLILPSDWKTTIELEIFVDHPAVKLIEGHPDFDALQSEIGDPVHLPPGGLIGDVRLEIQE